jgi:plastocyanin
MSRPHRPLTAPAGVAAMAAAMLLSGCSSAGPAADSHPSINFGPQASVTPGMTGGASPASEPAPAGPNAVSISNFAFAPATLTVPVGTTVTWTNHDEEPHTVVASDGSFHSPGLGTNAAFSNTFATAGTFDYICSIHPFMHGTVVVTK